MQDDDSNDPLYLPFSENIKRQVAHNPLAIIEFANFWDEREDLDREQASRLDEAKRKHREILRKRKELAERKAEDDLSQEKQAINLEFKNKRREHGEEYRRRWHLHPTVNYGIAHYNNIVVEQGPSATQVPGLAMWQAPMPETDEPPQYPESPIFALFPRSRINPPSQPIDPRMLERDVQVRPGSASPSAWPAQNLEADAEDEICDNVLPCRKGLYTCDNHKEYQQITD